jgi:hypothetical protein
MTRPPARRIAFRIVVRASASRFPAELLAVELLGERETRQEKSRNHVRSTATYRGGDLLSAYAVGDDGVVTDDLLVVPDPEVDACRPGAIGGDRRVPKPGVEVVVP